MSLFTTSRTHWQGGGYGQCKAGSVSIKIASQAWLGIGQVAAGTAQVREAMFHDLSIFIVKVLHINFQSCISIEHFKWSMNLVLSSPLDGLHPDRFQDLSRYTPESSCSSDPGSPHPKLSYRPAELYHLAQCTLHSIPSL